MLQLYERNVCQSLMQLNVYTIFINMRVFIKRTPCEYSSVEYSMNSFHRFMIGLCMVLHVLLWPIPKRVQTCSIFLFIRKETKTFTIFSYHYSWRDLDMRYSECSEWVFIALDEVDFIHECPWIWPVIDYCYFIRIIC